MKLQIWFSVAFVLVLALGISGQSIRHEQALQEYMQVGNKLCTLGRFKQAIYYYERLLKHREYISLEMATRAEMMLRVARKGAETEKEVPVMTQEEADAARKAAQEYPEKVVDLEARITGEATVKQSPVLPIMNNIELDATVIIRAQSAQKLSEDDLALIALWLEQKLNGMPFKIGDTIIGVRIHLKEKPKEVEPPKGQD